jgi:hypothetical protein
MVVEVVAQVGDMVVQFLTLLLAMLQGSLPSIVRMILGLFGIPY